MHEVDREWGSGLRTPPLRAAGQERSKWLRDERDVDWGKNFWDSNYYQQFLAKQREGTDKEINHKRNSRDNVHGGAIISGIKDIIENSNSRNINFITGPTEEELSGLNFEERKCRRSGLTENEFMNTDGSTGMLHTVAALSKEDCAASSSNILAKLVEQASQGL